MCRRLGRIPEARASYEKALALAGKEPDRRRFLDRRLAELEIKKFAYAGQRFGQPKEGDQVKEEQRG